jgi:hypothetical protein
MRLPSACERFGDETHRCCGTIPLMTFHEFHSEVWLPVNLDTVLPSFSDAANLQSLTPPWMHFRIVTPEPITMRVGATIDYKPLRKQFRSARA